MLSRTREHGDAGEGGDADERQVASAYLTRVPHTLFALALDQRGELVGSGRVSAEPIMVAGC